ncbi:alpha/beta fold hydrolase [Rhizobium rhizogenes]|uniref:alpha/beta fold hydrolase n=1 Tax=Rhizobium rhizogenes TaxID=359 RepID=UPI001296676F|nr:alpha/beta hydrolase [Rhizobium rhizogenes]MQB34290.1 alpha/beta hydrolase [Rhizobium rhizogenes]
MKYFIADGEGLQIDAISRKNLRGSFVALGDGVTHYELSGPEQGPLAILVGGLTIPLFYWDAVASRLHEQGLRTLTYSFYGRGYSDRVTLRYDEALFLRQLAELIDALGLSGPHHIVGSSMGALVAMGHISRFPKAAATLAIAGPAGLAKKPLPLRLLLSGDRQALFIARKFGRHWLASHEKHNLGDTTRSQELAAMLRDSQQYQGSLHAIIDTIQNFPLFGRTALYRAIGALALPTLLIWGREDRVTPISKIGAAESMLMPQQTHVLECGHMVPFERASATADAIGAMVCRYVQTRSKP